LLRSETDFKWSHAIRATYDHGIPFLQNIAKNFIDLSNVVYISTEMDEEIDDQIKPYDVILTITGYPGTKAVATPDSLPLNMSQHSV
jgi:hypothetical protein